MTSIPVVEEVELKSLKIETSKYLHLISYRRHYPPGRDPSTCFFDHATLQNGVALLGVVLSGSLALAVQLRQMKQLRYKLE